MVWRVFICILLVNHVFKGKQMMFVLSCEDGYFKCANNTKCIHQWKNCDGIPDCVDASDETNCNDEHGSKYWDNLLRKNPLAEYDDDQEKHCKLPYNGSCACSNRNIACQHRGLQKAPSDLPRAAVVVMDLSGNDFHALTRDTLSSVWMVEKLVMKHCKIADVAERTFYNFRDMAELYLDNNQLRYFPADLFPVENELLVLALARNQLTAIETGAFSTLSNLEELDLSFNRLDQVRRELLKPLVNLLVLKLNDNRIRTVNAQSFPALPLTTLSLANNLLKDIPVKTFATLPTLTHLFLSGNQIRNLARGAFYNLSSLTALNLNHNGLKTMEGGLFEDVTNLTSLELSGNSLKSVDKETLVPLVNLNYIYFESFSMCVAAIHVRVCEPKGDGISSQEHLLDNAVLRASVWIVGSVGCVGNLMVLLGRYLAPSKNVVHSLYIKNLALSDLLMGVYLFTIASVDHKYRGVYLQHQQKWRHSTLCNLCGIVACSLGFLSTLSCESSVLILSLVTWDRFISITQPLASKQHSPKAAAFTLLLLWMVALMVALAPLITITEAYFGDEFYGSNGVCLSLHIHDPYEKGWEYSAVLFIFVNTVALFFICYAYCRMIHDIRESSVACRSTRHSHDRDKVTQRFGVIILTDCMCWVPIILVKTAALSGVEISESLYAWLAVLVLPINSALNPVLYTLTTTLFVKQIRKIFHACMDRRLSHENQNSDSVISSVFPLGSSTKRMLSYKGAHPGLSTTKTGLKRSTAV